MYVERSLDRGYKRKEIGISRRKLLNMRIKKEFKKFFDGAKGRTKKFAESCSTFVKGLTKTLTFKTRTQPN